MTAGSAHPCALAYRVAQHRMCDTCRTDNGKLRDCRYMSCVLCGFDECMACVEGRRPAGLLGQLAALASGVGATLLGSSGSGSGAAPAATLRLQQRVTRVEAVVPHSPPGSLQAHAGRPVFRAALGRCRGCGAKRGAAGPRTLLPRLCADPAAGAGEAGSPWGDGGRQALPRQWLSQHQAPTPCRRCSGGAVLRGAP